MSPARTTVVKGGIVVGFDGREHRIIEDGFVAYAGDRITGIGRAFIGTADETIDARGKLVLPGLVNTHAHAGIDVGGRMIVDAGRRDLFRSGFFNYEPAKGKHGRSFFHELDARAALRYGLAALLRHGTTTAVELGGGDGGHDETMIDLAGEIGIRLYYGPLYYAGHYYFDEDGHFHLEPDDKQGFAGLDRAIRFIETHDGAHDGRVRGMLMPSSFIRTPKELFRRTKEAAARLKVGITFHLAESLWEFQETVRNHGASPVGVVADWDVLGPEVILGHVIYVGGHSQTAWPYKGDLEAIARSGATVAHAPLSFARRGMALESFQRYREHGINLGIGTDTYPLDILDEMRTASLAAKLVDHNFESAHARDVFNAATLGGAKALGRDDLGRLAPGAKADIVVVDLDSYRLSPFLDPIRALVYGASGDDVETVIVDGRVVVERGSIKAWDRRRLIADAAVAARKVWDGFPDYDIKGRRIDEVYPPCFKRWAE